MEKQPRVLFVDHAGVLGGAELYLLDVVRHFRRTARVVLFEDGPFRKRLEEEGVAVQVLAAPPALVSVEKESSVLQGLLAIPGVLRLVAGVAQSARSFDVIYANSQKALVVAALAGVLARRPVIWNLHDVLTADHFSAFNRRLAVTLANCLVDRVIVNSEATRQAFVESGGQGKKTTLVYNGIDAAPFEAVSASQVEQLRTELGIAEKGPVIGVFSRLAPWKGQHVLLEALSKLPSAHALLVGEALFGPDGDYAHTLHSQAEQNGLADRVHFLGFRDDVPALMQMVDIVAHTSVAPEPFGRVIVEGQLAHRPVVATRAGGALEIIDHGKTGFLVPPGDSEALVEVLRDLSEDPMRARQVARRGQAMAVERFSREAMLQGVAAQLDQVIGGR